MGERWTVTLCPFLHFDNARTNTYEQNISIVAWNVKSVLDFLEINPGHTFGLGQVTLLEGFRRLFPNYWDTLHQYVLEGRIEIVGGTYVMPDFVLPDGESIVRQFEYGTEFLRKELGVSARTGWAIDTSGHCAQMPQILRQCGIDTYYFTYGMPFDAPTEFVWLGPDGSRVNAVWLRNGFDCAAWLSENRREAFSNLLEIIGNVRVSSSSNNLFVPIGGELVPPPMHIMDIVRQWNEVFQDSKATLGTPREFSEKLKSVQSNLPSISGELGSGRFGPIRSGGLSSRSKLKILNRRLETLLYLVELYFSLGGNNSYIRQMTNLWKMLLFNQDHNIIRGIITDDPYKLAIRRYNQAIEKAEELLETAITGICKTIPAPLDGLSFIVFNPVPWTRSDITRLRLNRSMLDGGVFDLLDEEGNSIYFQIEDAADDENRVDIIFTAESLPCLGYRTYNLRNVEQPPEPDEELRHGRNWIESPYFTIEFDEFSGALTRIFDKTSQKEFIQGSGVHPIIEPDMGDLYRFAPSLLSGESSVIDSLRIPGKLKFIESGPVRIVTEVIQSLSESTIIQRVTVYRSLPRIDIEVEVNFREEHKRCRYVIPTPIFTDSIVTGAQFYANERHIAPFDAESDDHGHGAFSALDWVDVQGPDAGLGVAVFGLHEFQYRDGKLSITMLRSPSVLSHGKDDDAVQSMSARDHSSHTFRISLFPHNEDWKKTGIHRQATETRLPLIASVLDGHPDATPMFSGLVSVEGVPLELSSYRPTEHESEVIIRMYEVLGSSGTSILKFNRSIERAVLTDLVGNEIGEIAVNSNMVSVPVDGYSIITLKVRLGT